MDEGTARFWTTIFGGITALGLVAGGLYSLVQYLDSREKDRQTLALQIAVSRLAARQTFNNSHLDLCTQAASAAGTIATGMDQQKVRAATDDFWRLYWGPLGIVEGGDVAREMVLFGECLQQKCEGKKSLALQIAHACRTEVEKDFELSLPSIPARPSANADN